MNYGISVLFRAIPLAMALFCFFYGGFIYFWGDDSSRMIAGPVVFFSAHLSGPVRDRSDDHPADHRNLLDFRQILPADHGLRGRNLHVRLRYGDLFGHGARRVLRGGTCRLGTRLITGCVATAATVSTRFKLITGNSADPTHDVNPEGFSLQQELIFETVAAFFAVVAWAWTFILLGGGTTAHFVASSVMAA